MEMWAEIRRRNLVGGLSKRAACREYGVGWETLIALAELPQVCSSKFPTCEACST